MLVSICLGRGEKGRGERTISLSSLPERLIRQPISLALLRLFQRRRPLRQLIILLIIVHEALLLRFLLPISFDLRSRLIRLIRRVRRRFVARARFVAVALRRCFWFRLCVWLGRIPIHAHATLLQRGRRQVAWTRNARLKTQPLRLRLFLRGIRAVHTVALLRRRRIGTLLCLRRIGTPELIRRPRFIRALTLGRVFRASLLRRAARRVRSLALRLWLCLCTRRVASAASTDRRAIDLRLLRRVSAIQGHLTRTHCPLRHTRHPHGHKLTRTTTLRHPLRPRRTRRLVILSCDERIEFTPYARRDLIHTRFPSRAIAPTRRRLTQSLTEVIQPPQ